MVDVSTFFHHDHSNNHCWTNLSEVVGCAQFAITMLNISSSKAGESVWTTQVRPMSHILCSARCSMYFLICDVIGYGCAIMHLPLKEHVDSEYF